MRISCTNGMASVNVGNSEIWKALVSTVNTLLKKQSLSISKGIAFFNSGSCISSECLETARQINLIRDALSAFKPNEVVFDEKNPSYRASWANNISPVITSCANYFITADGHDLLSELVGLLCIGFYSKQDVSIT